MAFQDHYSEVLDVTSDMFCHIFDNIKAQLGPELEAIRKQARATRPCHHSAATTFCRGYSPFRSIRSAQPGAEATVADLEPHGLT